MPDRSSPVPDVGQTIAGTASSAQAQMRLVHRALTDAAAADPELPWLQFVDGETYTLTQLNQRVESLAIGLQQRGVTKGERVAIMASNTIEFVETWFAAHLVGAVVVPLNTAIRGDVLAHMLALADPSLIIVERALVTRVVDALGSATSVRTLAVIGGRAGDQGAWAAIDYSELAGQGTLQPVLVTESDAASIMYTSGTTGPSKGVIWTHGSTWHMAQIPNDSHGYGPNDVLYICLPLFHATALVTLLFSALLGRSKVVIAERFSVNRFWSDVGRYRVSATSFLGAMGPLLLAEEPSPAERDHRLRTAMVVPAPPGTRAAFRERFGLEIVHAYGLSDFGWICWPRHGETVPDGSVGQVHDTFEAMIVDQDDHEVPAGTVGEMVARPRQPASTSPGYWGMPLETLQSRRNLWFHTGDLMSRDAEGFFYFSDRAKDAMRRRGENVSSYEVERAIAKHPAVQECAAYAIPSELSEDEIAVAVVLRPDVPSPSEREIVAYVEPLLPYFAVPRYVRILDAIPKTQTEKIQKHVLRADGVTADTWDAVEAGVVISR